MGDSPLRPDNHYLQDGRRKGSPPIDAGKRVPCIHGDHARCAILWPVENYKRKGTCICDCHR